MSAFKWSSPIRSSGSKLLSPIPHEVYLEIFDYIEPSDDIDRSDSKRVLSKLALVCRFFCSISLPRLFRILHISALSHKETDSPNYAPFCRAVIKGQEPAQSLSHYVKECAFISWAPGEGCLTWCHDAFLGMYMNAITRMSNIETFTLKGMTIDKRMLRCIRSLQNLKSLEIRTSEFAEDIKDNDIQKLSSLRLSSLILAVVDEEDELFISLAQALNLRYLKTLETNSRQLLRELASQNKDILLEKLLLVMTMKQADFALLSKAADRMKSLNDLMIPSLDIRDLNKAGFALSKSSLRNLKRLVCPPVLSPHLIPGRPVERVSLTESFTGVRHEDQIFLHPLDIIRALKSSSTSVKSLSVHSSIYFATPLSEHFPYLEELELIYFRPGGSWLDPPQLRRELDRIIERICDAWPKTLPLQRLQVKFDVIVPNTPIWNLTQQHNLIITVLQPKFQLLRHFSISEEVHWEKDDSSIWKAFVPVQYRRDVLAVLSATDDWRDYNGCFAAVRASCVGS